MFAGSLSMLAQVDFGEGSSLPWILGMAVIVFFVFVIAIVFWLSQKASRFRHRAKTVTIDGNEVLAFVCWVTVFCLLGIAVWVAMLIATREDDGDERHF